MVPEQRRDELRGDDRDQVRRLVVGDADRDEDGPDREHDGGQLDRRGHAPRTAPAWNATAPGVKLCGVVTGALTRASSPT